MISRRNIRVKVMQTLYTVSTAKNNPSDPQRVLNRHFEQSGDLFQYILYFINEVASYAEKDALARRSKHLPDQDDLNVNTKIAGNEWLWKMKEDPSLQKTWNESKPSGRIDPSLVKQIYRKLKESDPYRKYVAAPGREAKTERDILEFIFEDLLLPDETFIHHLEEHFTNWDDDSEMAVQLVKAYLQKPGSTDFDKLVSADKGQFARSLLSTVLEKSEHLETYIFPKLKNWDAERIAALDMILMKMGVAELLYFETIPPKVTINEYIELAKEYSTEQSGQFVNGILDNIHKELVQDGKLNKTDFKKN